MAVYAADIVNVGNVYGDEVAPTVHKEPVAGNAEIADGGNLPKGDGHRIGRVGNIENMDALALFEHKKEGISQENGTAQYYRARRQAFDVAELRQGDVNWFFPHAAERFDAGIIAAGKQPQHQNGRQKPKQWRSKQHNGRYFATKVQQRNGECGSDAATRDVFLQKLYG